MNRGDHNNSQTSIKARIHTRKIKRKKVRAFNTPATQAAQKPKTAVVLVKWGLVLNQHTSRARNILTTQVSVLKTITTLAHYNGSKGERETHTHPSRAREHIRTHTHTHSYILIHTSTLVFDAHTRTPTHTWKDCRRGIIELSRRVTSPPLMLSLYLAS